MRQRLRLARQAINRRWFAFVDRVNALDVSENAILLTFAVVIGVGSALGVVGFYRAIDLAYATFFGWPAAHIGPAARYARPLVTAAGLGLAWWIMKRLGRGHTGVNVPDVQLAVVKRRGEIPARAALARTLASAVTIGSGGSAGTEGPVVVFGAALGSWLSRRFRFSPNRVRVLVGAGAAAAIAAAFNAPLAGAFFALEEILGSLEVSAFPAVVVSSVSAAIVSRTFFGNHPAFPIPRQYGYASLTEVALFYPILGAVCGLTSALFVRIYFDVESAAARTKIPAAVLPWVGGALVGALVLLSGDRLIGTGHLAVQLEVFGRMAWWTLALLAIGKIVATSLTLNTGGSGGLFTPSIFVGAAAGGAVGVILFHLAPSLAPHPEAYALVGMSAVIAGATDAPIAGILIVFEMTNDYAIVPPLMVATVVSHLVARRLERDSLYSGWLRRRGERLEHGAARDVLTELRVNDAYDPTPLTIPDSAALAEVLDLLTHATQNDFPVVDDEGNVLGLLTISDIGRLARGHRNLETLVLAADIVRPAERVTRNATLHTAMRRLGTRGDSALVVVQENTEQIAGLLTRAHIIAAYERAMEERGGAEESVW